MCYNLGPMLTMPFGRIARSICYSKEAKNEVSVQKKVSSQDSIWLGFKRKQFRPQLGHVLTRVVSFTVHRSDNNLYVSLSKNGVLFFRRR